MREAAALIRAAMPALMGVLALAAASCQAHPTHDATADPYPHRSAFVSRAQVRLHYLDWGGNGPAVILLPGYALTAHAFDDIAGALTPDYRAISVTPRGFGESDAPDSGTYSIATLVDDLQALLDSLGIQGAALVGHSMSGATITEFAAANPTRVSRLVYLDAFPFFAAAGEDSISALSPVGGHGFSGEMTYGRVREFLATYRFGGWAAALEADLRANQLGLELARRQGLTAGYVRDQRLHPPDVGRVSAPVLQLCAIPSIDTEYPWLRRGTREYDDAQAYVNQILAPYHRRLCATFSARVAGATTVEVPGSHYVFFLKPSMAAAAIRDFLAAR